MKYVRIRSSSRPYFRAFGLNTARYPRISPYSVQMRENRDQKNLQIQAFFKVYIGKILQTVDIPKMFPECSAVFINPIKWVNVYEYS